MDEVAAETLLSRLAVAVMLALRVVFESRPLDFWHPIDNEEARSRCGKGRKAKRVEGPVSYHYDMKC